MQAADYLDRHYIGIRKQSETEELCDYEFICTEYRRIGTKRLEQLGYVTGVSRIDKQTGNTELVRPMAGDEDLRAFNRASYKIRKCWLAGELPSSEQYCAG
ncbi:hypothetical protein IM53_008790 [Xanthomonas phaseoli pv. dieffenbachiae]|uniref:Uncharacterized protein n=1 Tax=Xanthomonas phaseoli pv. dieffenbachiae TaxID=92828 RepID=A0A1V9HBB8_9XANT|nr:hypothetical protein IM53_008790 [Xanthomonas phaseoli pv. dieffenbachiae]